MNVYLITFRSVTHAQRAAKLLDCGQVLRTPRRMEQEGCGYALRIRTEDVEALVRRLDEAGIPRKKVWHQTGTGEVEAL